MKVCKAEDRNEHEHAAGHRIQHELDGCVDTLVVAPDSYEEIHGDEHGIPEHVEEKQVEGDEHADHRGFEHQHEHRKLFHLAIDRAPRRQQRDRREKAGQHDQQQTDAVDAEVIVDAERRNPRISLHELELGRGTVETRPHEHGDRKRRNRNRERQPANHAVASAVGVSDEQQGQRAGDGQQPGKRQEHLNSQLPTPKSQLRELTDLSPQVKAQNDNDADEHRAGIRAHRAGLQTAQHT
jgi:hypothetical protein